jgi:RHS repeat-associated protein
MYDAHHNTGKTLCIYWMRKWSSAGTYTGAYLFGDHLHSASLATNTAGTSIGRQHYCPHGSHRDTWGSLTDKDFTGQRRDSTIELLDYGARRYDSYLGRFIQPDTIVPDPTNPQSLNRIYPPDTHCSVVNSNRL